MFSKFFRGTFVIPVFLLCILLGCGKESAPPKDEKLSNSFWSYSELISISSFSCQFKEDTTFTCLEGVRTGISSLNVMGIRGNYKRDGQYIALSPKSTTCPARKDTLIDRFKEAKLFDDSTIVIKIGTTGISMKRTTVDTVQSGTSKIGCIFDNRSFEPHDWESF